MSKIMKIYWLIFIILISNSCTTTQVTHYSQLEKMKGYGPLRVHATDSLVYTFSKFDYNDTAIFGLAAINHNSNNFSNKRNVQLKFKDIVYIEKYQFSILKTLWLTLSFSTLSIFIASFGTDRFRIEERQAGVGSCPYIYSKKGNDYLLEGEAFGISLGKQLESETGIILRNSETEDGKVKMKITNERPETHFINSVKLFAYEKTKNKYVFSDNNNSILQISNLKKVTCSKHPKSDSVSKLISEIDGKYLESDLTTANYRENYEDKILVEINEVSKTDSVTLIINAINTDISAEVFKYIQNILGEEYANFVKAVDEEPELHSVLMETLERASLKIDVWDGHQWVYLNKILPEASAINFSKAVRLSAKFDINGSLYLRLRSLTDVWKIDAVYYDDSKPYYPRLIQSSLLQHNTDSHNGRNMNIILTDDNKYMTLLPNNSLELVFSVPENNSNKDFEYVVFVKGYLYEWFIDSSNVPGEILVGLDNNTPRLRLVKSLLKDIDKILPVIYDEWRLTKSSRMSENR